MTSPLQRRLLVALLSLIRETEPDPEFWDSTDVKLHRVYERCYRLDPGRSYERQRLFQRQAMRRALGRLHPEFVSAYALAWCNVADGELIRWQGGGSGKRSVYETFDGNRVTYRDETPRWRVVGLTPGGIRLAELVERDG